jgi:hypothetical protein
MLFTALIPHARAAERQRAALSIIWAGSKFFGTTLAVATPMLSVVASSPWCCEPGPASLASSEIALCATAKAARRSQFEMMAAVR